MVRLASAIIWVAATIRKQHGILDRDLCCWHAFFLQVCSTLFMVQRTPSTSSATTQTSGLCLSLAPTRSATWCTHVPHATVALLSI
jgi:hypothetical protein